MDREPTTAELLTLLAGLSPMEIAARAALFQKFAGIRLQSRSFETEIIQSLTLYLADYDNEELGAIFEYLRTYKLGFSEHFGDPAIWRQAYEPAMVMAKKGYYDRMKQENRDRQAKELGEPRLTEADIDEAQRVLSEKLGLDFRKEAEKIPEVGR